MRQLVCVLKGGYVPVRHALSSRRIFCSRCGIELEKILPVLPAKVDAPQTMVKRFVRSTFC